MNEHIGYWVLVYLEPIEVSGERVVIGIVAKDADGKVFCQLALSAEGLRENGRRLAKIIDITVMDVAYHFHSGKSIESWVPTFAGSYLGTPIKTASKITKEFLGEILRKASVLYSLSSDCPSIE